MTIKEFRLEKILQTFLTHPFVIVYHVILYEMISQFQTRPEAVFAVLIGI
jgi:hypothetical protein